MKIKTDTVHDIAALARLSLTPEEEDAYARQLTAVLDYMERLREVEPAEPPVSSSPTLDRLPFREDATREGLPREKALAEAPDGKDGFFRVPKVIDA